MSFLISVTIFYNWQANWELKVSNIYAKSSSNSQLNYWLYMYIKLDLCSGMQVAQSGNPLEGKLYDTLQHQVKQRHYYHLHTHLWHEYFQIWCLLPGFCSGPVDLCQSFGGIARILGTALKEKAELRPIVCHALKLLIDCSKDSGRANYV